jgi:thiol-disulfide isomerase/thioredoxin
MVCARAKCRPWHAWHAWHAWPPLLLALPLLLVLCTSAPATASVSNGTVPSPGVAVAPVFAASQFHADASISYFRKTALADEAQRAVAQVGPVTGHNGTQGNGTVSERAPGTGMALNGITDSALAGDEPTGEGTANSSATNKASGSATVGAAATAVSQPAVDHIVGQAEFNVAISSDALVFVKFFSPRCPHCRTMAPAYAAIARRTQGSNLPLRIMNVDCTEEPNRSMCEAQVPAGYPTLKLFSKGEIVDEYTGVRDETSMMRWLEHAVEFRDLPRVERLTSKDDLIVFLNKTDDRPIVIAAVTHATPSYLKNEWLAAVDVMRDSSAKTVAFATVPDWTYLAGDAGSNLNRMHQKANVYNIDPFALASPSGGTLGDNNTEPSWWFDGVVGADCLETFMHISTLPRVRAIMTPQNAPFLSATSRPLAILFGRTPGPGWVVERALRFLADEPDILAIYASSTDLPGFRRYVGLDQLEPVSTYADYDHLDFVLFRAPSSGIEKIPRKSKKRPARKTMLQLTQKYLKWGVNMTERRSDDEPVRDKDVVNHTTKAFSVPREVVASSWARIVERDGRAVLLQLYREDCPSCKVEQPKFEETCELLYSDALSVFCVRMNIDANDLPPYMVPPHQVPATYVLVNGEEPLLYTGPATASALATFARLVASPPHVQEALMPLHRRPVAIQGYDSVRHVYNFGTVLVGLGMFIILTGLFWRLRATRGHTMAPMLDVSEHLLPRSPTGSCPPRKLV